MKHAVGRLVILLLIVLAGPLGAKAESWPKLEAALDAWRKPKELALVTDLADPLASPLVRELLDSALERGFAVLPCGSSPEPGPGLVLELRRSGRQVMPVLRRASDGAILALERPVPAESGVTPEPRVPTVRPPAAAAAPSPSIPAPAQPARPIPPASPADPAPLPAAPIPLAGRPRSLTLLAAAGRHELELAVQSDGRIDRYRLRDNLLEPLDTLVPEDEDLRALYLESGDADGDGRREMVALWAEDVHGIYQGTDSRLRSTLLQPATEGFEVKAGPRNCYIRLLGERAMLQKRGRFTAWDGPVRPLALTSQGWRSEDRALPWGGGNLFEVTPFDRDAGLRWTAAHRLTRVALQTGQLLPGGTLLHDLGDFQGARIAIPLQTPEYRAGFGKEDQVRETWAALPPRLTVSANGTAFTVRRGRSMGLPLIGKATGSDRLVGVRWNGRRLVMTEPFSPVEAFILDFALVQEQGRVSAALLLLNDRSDGSGQAYLQMMFIARQR